MEQPIQFMIVRVGDSAGRTDSLPATTKPGTVLVAARELRLWDVQELDGDSSLLESRGLLTDSAGVITLPPDSGTYLVEAWTTSNPPDSLDLRIRAKTSTLPNSQTCLTTLAKGDKPSNVRGCERADSLSPSYFSGAPRENRPDVVAMVRIPGTPLHRIRILGVSEDTLPIGESRLWQLNTGDLSFRGILRQKTSPYPDLPAMKSRQIFVLETWEKPGMANSRVAAKVDSRSLDQALQTCLIQRMADPLPDVMTLHACHLDPVPLSGGPNPPEHWAFLEYIP